MSTAATIDVEALFEALTRIEGKAEIVRGEIVLMPPMGPWPGYAAGMVLESLHRYQQAIKIGHVAGSQATDHVTLPQRNSFSPDAAYFIGGMQPMKYYEGAPQFAVEIRSAGDYGPRAERLMADKRADYFAAGTRVVWDVDLVSNDVVRVYRTATPAVPMIYRPGETAEAEPAVPGWSMPVYDLLPEGWTSNFDERI